MPDESTALGRWPDHEAGCVHQRSQTPGRWSRLQTWFGVKTPRVAPGRVARRRRGHPGRTQRARPQSRYPPGASNMASWAPERRADVGRTPSPLRSCDSNTSLPFAFDVVEQPVVAVHPVLSRVRGHRHPFARRRPQPPEAIAVFRTAELLARTYKCHTPLACRGPGRAPKYGGSGAWRRPVPGSLSPVLPEQYERTRSRHKRPVRRTEEADGVQTPAPRILTRCSTYAPFAPLTKYLAPHALPVLGAARMSEGRCLRLRL